jgi:hypothetical protein
MRARNKLLFVSVVAAGVFMGLLLTGVLTTHLLANREMVRGFVVSKTARATGGSLAYDRLAVRFVPWPRLQVENIELQREGDYSMHAQTLAVYPRLLPLIIGEVRIRRLVLESPDFRVNMMPGGNVLPSNASPQPLDMSSVDNAIRTALGGMFGALAIVDPGTELRIERGTATLVFNDAPDLSITEIEATAKNEEHRLSLSMACRSPLTGKATITADADVDAKTVRGELTLTSVNTRPVFYYASLPADIATEKTAARVNATFAVDSKTGINSRFELSFPQLTVRRKQQALSLTGTTISGELNYADQTLSLFIHRLQTTQPELEFAAEARIGPADETGGIAIELKARAEELEVADAAGVTLDITGDLDEIQTAFAVAREGLLTRPDYLVRFENRGDGFRLAKMKGTGHLTHGRVTIPGIEADVESLDGEVVFEDQQVIFNTVSGRFKGAAFEKLDAGIDWENEARLFLSSPQVRVDTAELYSWLTSFEALGAGKEYVDTIAGDIHLSVLEIDGPLTRPADWSYTIQGTPEAVCLQSPLMPFEVGLSGGRIKYVPGNESLENVKLDFLDGAFVASYQTAGIANPEFVSLRLNGSMGAATLDWLDTLLPKPEHLQLKPPVDVADINVAWFSSGTFSLKGELKTAGGVDVFADFTHPPDTWQIRKIQFDDGRSQATVSGRVEQNTLLLDFTGDIDKPTADRLLRENWILSGRVSGDFRLKVDRDDLRNAFFRGKLTGEGLHFPHLLAEPLHVGRFAVSGRGHRLTAETTEVSFCDSRMIIDGVLDNQDGDLWFDLDLKADRLDDNLIRNLRPGDRKQAGVDQKQNVRPTPGYNGNVHLKTETFAYKNFTWSPVEARVRMDRQTVRLQIDQADLCGISTTGELEFSPRGLRLQITPEASDAALQATIACLRNNPVDMDARYDLTGEIKIPPTRLDYLPLMTGHMEFSSTNGTIQYANVLMKIFSVLNVTEVFAGGASDLTEKGYGYTVARATADIGGGKLVFNEILLDGNSLKITGQGSIDLRDQEVDVTLLAAPLKTVDRLVNKIPIISYITGGSLVSIPLRLDGRLNDIQVTTMPPAAVGKGLLNLMQRTLKAPFKLMEGAASLATPGSGKPATQ